MTNSSGTIAAIGILCAALPATAGAQGPALICQSAGFADAVTAPLPVGRACPPVRSPRANQPAPGKAFLYSLVLPGAGQQRLGQKRWLAYVALEAAAWIEFARARSDGGRLRDEYHTLAWDVARTFGGPRVDGDFAYYEALTLFSRSGAFDGDPTAAGVQPEQDATTFNGNVWSLAMSIFFSPGTTPGPGDPSFELALDFYRERSYGEEFLWDWTGSEAQSRRYEDVIRASDRRFRRASLMAGALLGNHLVSALDAFLSARVRSATNGLVSTRFRSVPIGMADTRLEIGISIRP